jgi:hypothetical protein
MWKGSPVPILSLRLYIYFYAAFDPKPFISTFEAAVDRLIALRKENQAKTEQMEKSVRVAEREYSKKMSDLNRGFEVRLGRLVVRFKSF